MKRIFLFLAGLLLSACSSTPLYVTDSGVSIYLAEEPEVEADRFKITFTFESPTDDPHLVQTIELYGTAGIESFRANRFTNRDVHWTEKTDTQYRRMTIMPGEVVGADERNGFAMLPSDWLPGMNADYLDDHKIQGKVVFTRPEFQTIYHLDFEYGKLVWYIEGKDVRMEWSAK
jgi:hypothetical protein